VGVIVSVGVFLPSHRATIPDSKVL
jgi:hypothetical protein